MKQINYDIELWRFIGIVSIAFFHVYATGIPYGSYHLAYGWVFTDAFFVISGYFTVKYLMNSKAEKKTISGIRDYIWNKIKRILPYTIPSMLLVYFIDIWERYKLFELSTALKYFFNMILELFMLTSAFNYGHDSNGIPLLPLNAPLWFLSAMFIVMPIFCFCVCHNFKGIFWILSIAFIFLDVGVSRNRWFLVDLLRAIAGLFSGMGLYCISEIIKRKMKIRSGYAGVALLFMIFILLCFNYRNWKVSSGLMELSLLLILASDVQVVPRSAENTVALLGRISVPLFICHWPIARVIKHFIPGEYIFTKMFLFVVFSAIASVILYFGNNIILELRRS